MHSKLPDAPPGYRGCPSPFTRLKRTWIPVLFFLPDLRFPISRSLPLLGCFARRRCWRGRCFTTRTGLRAWLRRWFYALLRGCAGLRRRGITAGLRGYAGRLLRCLLAVSWRDLLLSRRVAGGRDLCTGSRGACEETADGGSRTSGFAGGCGLLLAVSPYEAGERLPGGSLDTRNGGEADQSGHQPGQDASEEHPTSSGGGHLLEV